MLRGINYDVGTEFRKGKLTRPDFDESIVKKEIDIIRNELKCDVVRISGFEIKRLLKASEFALEQGLEVWLSPAYIDASKEETLNYLIESADAAEKLRKKYNNLTLIVGCEYSLFLKGFIRGETIYDRLQRMFNPFGILLNQLGLRQKVYVKLNRFLHSVVSEVKKHFKGKLTYASGTWEKIDWKLFDIVSIDHYRASYNKNVYAKQLREYFNFNKPVAVTEFGCCTYKGAEEKGGSGWAITELKDGRLKLKAGYIRDELVQANYITELLDLFGREKVNAAFVFTFINPAYKHNTNPELDLDMASYGIVKPMENTSEKNYKGLPWVPKEAFYILSNYNSNYNSNFIENNICPK